MRAHQEELENGVILSISGAIDLVSHNELHELLQKTANLPIDFLILNLKDCAYVDSSGLSCLISNLHNFTEKKKKMVIAQAEKIYKTLKVTGLTEAFAIFDSIEDAQKDLTAGG